MATSSGTSIKISQLIPGTNYLFRVSAITQRGRGAEISHVSQTERPLDSDGETNVLPIMRVIVS